MKTEGNILSFEKFRLKKFLEDQGFCWHEDKKGKVRIWIRKAKVNPEVRSPFFQGKP
ncbi:MAG: hypothetical protein OEV66_08470 [Spirochaetia bacterium]|nr:hypothetical protein [Spirochaetia bacterium]